MGNGTTNVDPVALYQCNVGYRERAGPETAMPWGSVRRFLLFVPSELTLNQVSLVARSSVAARPYEKYRLQDVSQLRAERCLSERVWTTPIAIIPEGRPPECEDDSLWLPFALGGPRPAVR
jgi:hypothetical protein